MLAPECAEGGQAEQAHVNDYVRAAIESKQSFPKLGNSSRVAVVGEQLVHHRAPDVVGFTGQHRFDECRIPMLDRPQDPAGHMRDGFKTIRVASTAIVERGKEDGRFGAEAWP
jgi:hypothetical protein